MFAVRLESTMTASPEMIALARRLAAGEIDEATFDRLRWQTSPLPAVATAAATTATTTAASQHSVVNPGSARDIVTGQQVNAQGAHQVILAQTGATVVIGDVPVPMTAVQRDSALEIGRAHV